MAGDFSLRRLGALDLDLASRLHGEAFAPLGERVWTRQDMAELVASRGIAGVVLQVEDEAIGFAVWRIAADEAELLTIAVLPNWRRRGAGRKLLDAVIADAREARAHSLFLEVGTDNPPALALYGKAGFAAVGSRQAYYRRGERPAADAVVMRLALISGG